MSVTWFVDDPLRAVVFSALLAELTGTLTLLMMGLLPLVLLAAVASTAVAGSIVAGSIVAADSSTSCSDFAVVPFKVENSSISSRSSTRASRFLRVSSSSDAVAVVWLLIVVAFTTKVFTSLSSATRDNVARKAAVTRTIMTMPFWVNILLIIVMIKMADDLIDGDVVVGSPTVAHSHYLRQ